MIISVFYFIVTLLMLILVHEAGHFWVARWCGVKVLRCSFGFGKVLAAWRDKQGTEYVWSLLPLGGYVKLLDGDEGPVPSQQRHQALNDKSLWIRFVVVLAGPLFNFIFAFILLWLVAVIGIKSFAPRIAAVRSDSIAAQAQLAAMQEIIAIDGKPINHWRDVHYVLTPLLGSKREVMVRVKSLHDGHVSEHRLPLAQWMLDPHHPELLDSLGMTPLFPKMLPVVDQVTPNSPAEAAGVHVGDVIVAVDDHPMNDWRDVVDYVKSHVGMDILLQVDRHGVAYRLAAQLRQSEPGSNSVLGVGARRPEIPPDWLRWERSGAVEALGQAWHQTVSLTSMTCVLIGRTLIGDLSLSHLSGPVGIAKAAAESIQVGWVYYLFFVALLSISVGVLNLLPIPILDGGHILYYLMELLIRRPLSPAFRAKAGMIGMGCIAILTVIALLNDLHT